MILRIKSSYINDHYYYIGTYC